MLHVVVVTEVLRGRALPGDSPASSSLLDPTTARRPTRHKILVMPEIAADGNVPENWKLEFLGMNVVRCSKNKPTTKAQTRRTAAKALLVGGRWRLGGAGWRGERGEGVERGRGRAGLTWWRARDQRKRREDNIENIKHENEAAPERKRTLHEELEAAAGGAPDAVGKRKVRSRKREREREG